MFCYQKPNARPKILNTLWATTCWMEGRLCVCVRASAFGWGQSIQDHLRINGGGGGSILCGDEEDDDDDALNVWVY